VNLDDKKLDDKELDNEFTLENCSTFLFLSPAIMDKLNRMICDFMLPSAALNGVPVHLVGYNMKPILYDGTENIKRMKIFLYRNAFETIARSCPNTIVLGGDSIDAIILQSVPEILRKFRLFNSSIVVNAEKVLVEF
jgi:hypothetical protein